MEQEPPLSRQKLAAVRKKVFTIVEEGLAAGAFALCPWVHSVDGDSVDGDSACLLMAIAGQTWEGAWGSLAAPGSPSFVQATAKRLGITEAQAKRLEAGFEGWAVEGGPYAGGPYADGDIYNPHHPLAKLGVEVRERYVVE